MGKHRYIHFPLRLTPELRDLLHRAAFATGKSKHQYCIDAIRKEAERDAQGVQILIRQEDLDAFLAAKTQKKE